MAAIDERNPEQFYHGAKADLRPGELIAPGHRSNYGKRKIAAYVYLTATLDAAIWGAELALGEGPGRIYMVEATGPIEDDPNLTDKKYPGNPTRSYRSRDPLRVTGEVTDWQGHSPEKLKAMRDSVERSSDLALRRSRTELSSLMQQANRADVSETRPDASDFNPAFDRAALKNLRLRKPSYRLIDSPISTDRYIVLTNRSAYERAALERGHTALGSTFGGDVMSNIAKAVVGAFVAATSCAQLASAGSTHQYQKSAPSAERTQVGLYTSWKSDCIPVGGSVTMVQKPAHGTVDFAPASEVIEARYNGTKDCSGRTMDGTGIFYTSTPSFHGRDGFVVHTKANSGPYETDVTYSIDVK